MAIATRREVKSVKQRDVDFGQYQGVLIGRMRAVLAAQRAFAGRQAGAAPALRQSLIDLAAISEALADELPQPSGALSPRR